MEPKKKDGVPENRLIPTLQPWQGLSSKKNEKG